MLNQDPQKKISSITNRPRPIGVSDLNSTTGKQPRSGDYLGPEPNLAAGVNTTPQGAPPDTGASTPPEEKKGFLASMKEKLTNSGKEFLVKKVTGGAPPETEGPSRQVGAQEPPRPVGADSLPQVQKPKTSVPKPGGLRVPKLPNRPATPKIPKMR